MLSRATVLLCLWLLWPDPSQAASSAGPPPRQTRICVRPQAAEQLPDPKSFEVSLDKMPARIVRVLTPDDPQLILLVLDLVGDLGAIEPAKEALAAEIAKLPSSTYVGLLRAQDGMSVLVDPSRDHAAIADAVRKLSISGRPGLLETVEPVERLADAVGRKSQVRLSIVYVTDGSVSDYREDFSNPVINSSDPHDLSRKFPETLIQEKISKIQGLLARRQTPLHIVHISYRSDRLNEAYQNGLGQLAGQMAGTAAFCRSRAEIPDAIQAVFRAMASEYTLFVLLPENPPQMLQLQVTAGATGVVYRQRISVKEK